jgi:L-lactate dehydrogenase complex protein LldF
VCPVKIDLDQQLFAWRQTIVARRFLPWRKRALMKMLGAVLGSTRLYTLAGKMARWTVPWMPRFVVYNPLNAWGKRREIPEMPRHSFRELYRRRYGK